MTTIVLHIGMTKTGSSALQSMLDRYRPALSKLGLYYAPERPLPRNASIILGNGVDLALYFTPKRRPPSFSAERFEAEFETKWISAASPLSLLSSEVMANGNGAMIGRFKDQVAGGHPVKIVAVVRDIYSHAWSAWMQLIKRHAYAESFETYCLEKYRNPQFAAIERYSNIFSGNVSLLHYETIKNDLFNQFIRALGVNFDVPPDPAVVNRSLSSAEIEVLRECNRRYADPKISIYLSDRLLKLHPSRSKADGWFPDLAAHLEARFARDVDWINQRFFGGKPTLAIARPPGWLTEDRGPTIEEVWSDVDAALAERRPD